MSAGRGRAELLCAQRSDARPQAGAVPAAHARRQRARRIRGRRDRAGAGRPHRRPRAGADGGMGALPSAGRAHRGPPGLHPRGADALARRGLARGRGGPGARRGCARGDAVGAARCVRLVLALDPLHRLLRARRVRSARAGAAAHRARVHGQEPGGARGVLASGARHAGLVAARRTGRARPRRLARRRGRRQGWRIPDRPAHARGHGRDRHARPGVRARVPGPRTPLPPAFPQRHGHRERGVGRACARPVPPVGDHQRGRIRPDRRRGTRPGAVRSRERRWCRDPRPGRRGARAQVPHLLVGSGVCRRQARAISGERCAWAAQSVRPQQGGSGAARALGRARRAGGPDQRLLRSVGRTQLPDRRDGAAPPRSSGAPAPRRGGLTHLRSGPGSRRPRSATRRCRRPVAPLQSGRIELRCPRLVGGRADESPDRSHRIMQDGADAAESAATPILGAHQRTRSGDAAARGRARALHSGAARRRRRAPGDRRLAAQQRGGQWIG
jgi:hypothetical protein